MSRAAVLGMLGLGLLAACADEAPNPDVAGPAARQRGYLALQREDYPAAEAAFQEAAHYLPQDPFIQLDLGVTEQHLGKLAAARAAYTQAILYGKDVAPVDVTDPHYAGRTVAQLASDDLSGMDLPPVQPPKPDPTKPPTGQSHP